MRYGHVSLGLLCLFAHVTFGEIAGFGDVVPQHEEGDRKLINEEVLKNVEKSSYKLGKKLPLKKYDGDAAQIGQPKKPDSPNVKQLAKTKTKNQEHALPINDKQYNRDVRKLRLKEKINGDVPLKPVFGGDQQASLNRGVEVVDKNLDTAPQIKKIVKKTKNEFVNADRGADTVRNVVKPDANDGELMRQVDQLNRDRENALRDQDFQRQEQRRRENEERRLRQRESENLQRRRQEENELRQRQLEERRQAEDRRKDDTEHAETRFTSKIQQELPAGPVQDQPDETRQDRDKGPANQWDDSHRQNNQGGENAGHRPEEGGGEYRKVKVVGDRDHPDTVDDSNAARSAERRNEADNPFRVDPNLPLHDRRFESAPAQPVGRAEVRWDGDDFALMFGDTVYMEQKIRRASIPTAGSPWPKPQYMKVRSTRVYLIPPSFSFKITEKTCDVIEKAIKRYQKYILKYSLADMHDNLEYAEGSDFEAEDLKYNYPPYTNASALDILNVRVRTPCLEYPSETMDESYTLVVKKSRMYIAANEVWGALRGLETFSQMVVKGPDSRLYIKEVLVNDYPRFQHRGVLIDTSRHYIFKEVLYDALDGMAMNKLNVMHWHIVDDQSFPFESTEYPYLSKKGAFAPGLVYTHADIADIIEYARLRGIRVIPEFDTPGHTYSWGLGYPKLLTQCHSGPNPVKGYLGPMNPASNFTYNFLRTLYREILTVFKDKSLHLGGDEVPLSCWVSNPAILAFSEKIGAYGDTRKLMEYYTTRLLKIVEELAEKKGTGIRTMVWQDVLDTVDQLPTRVIVNVWRGGMPDVQRATSMGHQVIYSSCWYLDLIEYGSRWYKYYLCDPTDSSSGYVDERLVIGGEAALWAEYIDNENLMTTLWPRASATAERLWSHKDQRDMHEAGRRMIEHRCRMLGRGLAVSQISGPDYCPSRGPRKPISAGRLMEEDDPVLENPAAAPAKKLLETPHLGMEGVDSAISGSAAQGVQASNCRSWAAGTSVIPQGNGWLLLVLTILILTAVLFQARSNSTGHTANKILKNKVILFSFVTLIVIYVTCYTTIWLQVLDVKKSFSTEGENKPQHSRGTVARE